MAVCVIKQDADGLYLTSVRICFPERAKDRARVSAQFEIIYKGWIADLPI